MVNANQLKEATPVPSTNNHFDFEVRYNFEADPPIVSFKMPLNELQDLMAHKNGAITISHAEFAETLSALAADRAAPLHDRAIAIDLLKGVPNAR